MFIKNLVLFFGLLGGLNSSLNAVRPEHEARLEQLNLEWDDFKKNREKVINDLHYLADTQTVKVEDIDIYRAQAIALLKKQISLIEEALNYLQDPEDQAGRIITEKNLKAAKEELDIFIQPSSPCFFLVRCFFITYFWELFPEAIKILLCLIMVWLFWVWKNNVSVLSKKSMKGLGHMCLGMLLAAILIKIAILVLKIVIR